MPGVAEAVELKPGSESHSNRHCMLIMPRRTGPRLPVAYMHCTYAKRTTSIRDYTMRF
jgi:hypothetical protein